MSKLLTGLVQKAKEKGVGKVNGRQWDGGYGNLREKYKVEIENDIVRLTHWGTVTLEANIRTKKIADIYGQSVSDRDSVNFILNEFDLPYHVHFYPSRYEFELHEDKTEKVLKVI